VHPAGVADRFLGIFLTADGEQSGGHAIKHQYIVRSGFERDLAVARDSRIVFVIDGCFGDADFDLAPLGGIRLLSQVRFEHAHHVDGAGSGFVQGLDEFSALCFLRGLCGLLARGKDRRRLRSARLLARKR